MSSSLSEVCCLPARLRLCVGAVALLLASCGTNLPHTDEEARHLTGEPDGGAGAAIPSVVEPVPLVSPPVPVEEPELYTVVAQDVPVRDLLFTMARDAMINVDVHPDVDGLISINAIDQSLPQILERIARQIDIRWSFDASGNLVVEPDSAFWRTYRVDYVNVSRTTQTSAEISTSIVSSSDGGSAGANTSSSTMSQSTVNNFWTTLTANLANFLGEAAPVGGASTANTSIVTNPEAGVVTVRGTTTQHEQIAAYLNSIQTRSLYQVLIEATVVEVSLNDQYQSGVDWATVGRNSGELNFSQEVIGANLGSAPRSILTLDRLATPDAITATIALLAQFGELRVLSSPKIMALNNQSAMLRVVDNTVYFTIDVQPGTAATAASPAVQPTYTSIPHTVPVGFVMTVTPQVGENDQVTLNVRPTISRIVRFVNDPNPILAAAGVESFIPEIQVREIESILKVFSGQVAILGGLMQDSLSTDTDGLPVLSRLPYVRNLFSYRDDRATKTELIVFIRPVVIRQASLEGDLQQYRSYLPQSNNLESSSTTSLPELLRSQTGE